MTEKQKPAAGAKTADSEKKTPVRPRVTLTCKAGEALKVPAEKKGTQK